jgi:ribosomal RNA-processing protein 12
MSDIFSACANDVSSNIGAQLPDILKVVLSSPPARSDSTLSASWVQVLGAAVVAHNVLDPNAASTEVWKVWKSVWNFLDSPEVNTRKAAAQSLSSISSCFSPVLISASIADTEGSSTIRKIISQVSKALNSLSYAHSISEILSIISSLITHLRYRTSKSSPTAAELLLMPLLVNIADLRILKSFEYKEAADATLSIAMRILGPAVMLEALPLNLEPSSRYVPLLDTPFLKTVTYIDS